MRGVAVLFLALGVVVAGCAPVQKVALPVAPPPAAVASPIVLAPALPGPWRIRKTEWTEADEKGFGEFIRVIAESGCTTTDACMRSAANFYHDSDPPSLHFRADCAKWVYMLRAYYASKNGLPFSYVSRIAGNGPDLRFTTNSNTALERTDLVDAGAGLDTPDILARMHDQVYSGTYRMDPAVQAPVMQDFYSPRIQPGSIHAGTAIYDITGHVMIVYDITPDGGILYMDAHPDESVTRGHFGAHVPKSQAWLGGGFKNFRPLKLEGALLRADGTYVGGHVVLASNEAIADFSLEQYRGNIADAKADNPATHFRYNDASLDLYEYARAAMSNGGFAFNPVYEIQVAMGSICADAKDGSRDARNRVQGRLAALHADLSQTVSLWKQRDLRVVYHGTSLKETLARTYADQENACVVADGERVRHPLEAFTRRSADTDIQTLIAQIDDAAPFAGMRPVGY